MALKNENHFVCDLKKSDGTADCDKEFYYDPGRQNAPPPAWEPGVQAALNKIVAVSHPITQYVTFYCCDDHAIEAIKRGQHLPPLPPKIKPASVADMKNAARGNKQVEEMKTRPS
jgi:hypothetical protein